MPSQSASIEKINSSMTLQQPAIALGDQKLRFLFGIAWAGWISSFLNEGVRDLSVVPWKFILWISIAREPNMDCLRSIQLTKLDPAPLASRRSIRMDRGRACLGTSIVAGSSKGYFGKNSCGSVWLNQPPPASLAFSNPFCFAPDEHLPGKQPDSDWSTNMSPKKIGVKSHLARKIRKNVTPFASTVAPGETTSNA